MPECASGGPKGVFAVSVASIHRNNYKTIWRNTGKCLLSNVKDALFQGIKWYINFIIYNFFENSCKNSQHALC